ncbi:RimJ/RimL family protein N-acetyltransferase [Leucobacter exalbidus]|uniref:RimJ/RimL family protein N-acetyltransferase n=1 Tax=Leucobacter exalbidus TaxID=662960 RepID=A0A940PRH2_9MICO|nr:GNAT family protein [Leucobacter exalbidus]MBP1324890.1 RimJ/RimL family protein N-acetyltransferase [Leucobacter exalbidus]
MTSQQPVLVGPRVALRDPQESDVSALLAILQQPEVSLWWVGFDEARVRADFLEQPESTRVIELEGAVAGAVVVLRSTDPEYPTTIMHIFLGTQFRGQRIGEESLALAIRHEFNDGITRITLDPNVHNTGAIRSYERLGFKTIGVLRDYQLRPGGHMEDALFMDLTRSDFPEGPPLPQIKIG